MTNITIIILLGVALLLIGALVGGCVLGSFLMERRYVRSARKFIDRMENKDLKP